MTSNERRLIIAKYAALKRAETAKRDKIRKELEGDRKSKIRAIEEWHRNETSVIIEGHDEAIQELNDQEAAELGLSKK